MSRSHLAVIAGLVIVLLVFVGTRFLHSVNLDARLARTHAYSFESLRAYFEGLAKKYGGEYGFLVLEKAQLPPNMDLHLLGHAVGDVLYKQKGIAGISICTSNFRNACAHTMVIGAYTEFGEEALDRIRDTCKKAPGGPGAYLMCYHGLGHGIFAYYNYDLKETVDSCKKTGTLEFVNREYVECVGGAVMELSSSSGHDPEGWKIAREKYLTKPLSPCMDAVVPPDAKSQCLMYLTPELWKRVGIDLGRPDPDLFDDAFAFCDTISRKDADLKETCFRSFGKEFAVIALARDIRTIQYVPPERLLLIEEWCAKAPHVFGENACIAEAVNSLFWGGENNPEVSVHFCELVATRNADACFKSLAQNVDEYILSSTQKDTLCSKVPDKYRSICVARKL
jgi:hypothetical protein